MSKIQAPLHSQISESSDNTRKRLREYLTFFAYAMPAFGALLTAGYVLLFFMGRLNTQGSPSYSLLITAMGTMIAVLLAIPTRAMLASGQSSKAMGMYAVGFGFFFLFLEAAWQGFSILSIVGVWLPIILLYSFLENRKQAITLIAISIAFTLLILLSAKISLFQREAFNGTATLPAILLTVFVVLAFVSIAVITYAVKFRTLAARLITTFVAIILLPAVATTLVLSFQSYTHDQEMILGNMQVLASQKIDRINQIISAIAKDRDLAIRDPRAQAFILGILTSEPGSLYYQNSLEGLKEYFPARIQENGLYQNAILLDTNGNIVFSTDPKLVNLSLKDSSFFRDSLSSPINSSIHDDPVFKENTFVAASPVRSGSKTIGELALISDYSEFAGIVNAPNGTNPQGETYLIAPDFYALTGNGEESRPIKTVGTLDAIKNESSGSGVYKNSAGTLVLGTYQWLPGLGAAIISERGQFQSLSATFILIGNVLLIGVFAIVLSILAVIFTSNTLTSPIHDLEEAAESVSGGNLAARADAARPDEIGRLAESFNFMAASLGEIVNSLETRIQERTKDLQRQAIRLRAAAEVARDSAGALNLRELLVRSTELIGERFGFYHVGLYLVETNRESLILSAATGEAGKLMLETAYRLRIGDGIVGRTAQAQEVMLTGDLNQIAAGARNALFPGTRTELSLPLKANDECIGVLDIHSDQANAFGEEDVAALQLMADQLSGAIERTRVMQQSEDRLHELERNYQKYTRESWMALIRGRGAQAVGYKYEGVDFDPVKGIPPFALEAMRSGEEVISPISTGNSGANLLAVPIKVRGSSVGAVSLKIHGEVIPTDTTELAEEISERLAQSLEATILLEETTSRAERERIVAEITNKIRATNDPQTMLETAVHELKFAIGASKVNISTTSEVIPGES